MNKIRQKQGHLNANTGVQLGISVVPGGYYRNSLHCGAFLKNKPDLRTKTWALLAEIVRSVFGDYPWYKRMVKLTEKLNNDSGEQRTIPGMPFSGIWFTQSTINYGIHRDVNTVGLSVLISTRCVSGGHICLQHPSGDIIEHFLNPCEIIAGRWSEFYHCNRNVDCKTKHRRRAIIFYLDRACFDKSYTYVVPRGFMGTN